MCHPVIKMYFNSFLSYIFKLKYFYRLNILSESMHFLSKYQWDIRIFIHTAPAEMEHSNYLIIQKALREIMFGSVTFQPFKRPLSTNASL